MSEPTTSDLVARLRTIPCDGATITKAITLIEQQAAQLAEQRETVAAWMMAHGYATGHGDTLEALLVSLGDQLAEKDADIARAKDGRIDAMRAAQSERFRADARIAALEAERDEWKRAAQSTVDMVNARIDALLPSPSQGEGGGQ